MATVNNIVLHSIGGAYIGDVDFGYLINPLSVTETSSRVSVVSPMIAKIGFDIRNKIVNFINTHAPASYVVGYSFNLFEFDSSNCRIKCTVTAFSSDLFFMNVDLFTTSTTSYITRLAYSFDRYPSGVLHDTQLENTGSFFCFKDYNSGFNMGLYAGQNSSGGWTEFIEKTNTTFLNYLLDNSYLSKVEIDIFPGDSSVSGGGTGSFDNTSDEIDFPSVPILSAVSAGFITMYAPTISQLNSLASYMWSDSFDIDTFKKLFADPMGAIIGVSIVPVSVPVSGSQEVKIGFVGTGVTMNIASSQYVTLDCGILTPKEFWGSALDYSPYTKFSIYLPYIGTRELNADDIMGKTLHVKYVIDVLSGSCTAMIKCGASVLYQFSGACATAIPVTGQNWTQLITSCIQLAGAGVAVAASGGSAAGLLPSTASAVLAMKPNIQHTGAVSGSAGMLGVQRPYLIWELPRQSLPENYNKFVGYPSNISALLSSVRGFTQIEKIHLENIDATSDELQEIDSLLKEGVIF